MNDAHRRRMDKIDREKVFLTDNAADFPRDSPVDRLSVQINAKAAEAISRDAELLSALGDKSQAMTLKGNFRDLLTGEFKDVIRGAQGIGDAAVPGITSKFKVPYPRTEQNLIAGADSFYADTAPPLEQQLIDAGLESDFRQNILDAKDDFQQSRDNADGATGEHGEAVGALEVLFREMMQLSRQRSALVQLKYKNDPGKLAAWTIASHLEQPPQKKKPTPQA